MTIEQLLKSPKVSREKKYSLVLDKLVRHLINEGLVKTDDIDNLDAVDSAIEVIAALQERVKYLDEVAILAIRSVVEVGFENLKPHMQELDHYLANELPDDLWEELDTKARERK